MFYFTLALRFYVAVNIYSHVEAVSSHSHTFPKAGLIKRLTSCKYFSLNLSPKMQAHARARERERERESKREREIEREREL